MARGRKPIPVTKESLQAIVNLLEATKDFDSRSALWYAVENSDYAKSIGLKGQVAMLKAKTFGIKIKTPLGKRGKEKGSGPVPNAGVRRKKTIAPEVVVEMKKAYAPSLHKRIDRAAAGSLKAKVALACIDCCAGSKREVALCEITTCPLHSVRPYQGSYNAELRADTREKAKERS